MTEIKSEIRPESKKENQTKSSEDFFENLDKNLDKKTLLNLLDSLIKEQDLVAELNLNGDGPK